MKYINGKPKNIADRLKKKKKKKETAYKINATIKEGNDINEKVKKKLLVTKHSRDA